MRAWLSVLMLVALLPAALGGTSADPEVTDPAADVDGPAGGACPAGCAAAPQFIDLRAMWVQQESDALVFAIQIAGNHNANAYGEARFVAHFTLDGTEYMAGLAAGRSSTTGGDDSMTPIGVASDVSFQSDHVRVVVPFAVIGDPGDGTAVTGLFATTELDFGDQDDGTFADRAPDEGAGRDSIIAREGTGSGLEFVDVAGLPLDVTLNATEPTDVVRIHNWTHDGGNLTGSFSAQISAGALNVTITAPDGQRIEAACPCPDVPINLTATAGTWNITYEAQGFVGEARLHLEAAAPGPAPTPTATPTTNGNGTDDPDGGAVDEESPGPGVLLLVGIVAVGALVRRRG